MYTYTQILMGNFRDFYLFFNFIFLRPGDTLDTREKKAIESSTPKFKPSSYLQEKQLYLCNPKQLPFLNYNFCPFVLSPDKIK